MGDYLRCTDLEHVPEKFIARYDAGILSVSKSLELP
jgi:hypothetical protein